MKRRGFFASLLALPAVATGARAIAVAPAAPAAFPVRPPSKPPDGDHVFRINMMFQDEDAVARGVTRAIDAYRKKRGG